MNVRSFMEPGRKFFFIYLVAVIISNFCIHFVMSIQQPQPDGEVLNTLVKMKMPFGKYKGVVLCDLPVSYLEWFAKKGFPSGKLGMSLATLYEIKINGLLYLLQPLKPK
jgi:uncharacterized protein